MKKILKLSLLAPALKRIALVLFQMLLLLALAPSGQAQYTYLTNNGMIIITDYTGSETDLTIPSSINDLPVTSIGDSAFANSASLTSVTIPGCITNVGNGAFNHCNGLTNVVISDGVIHIGDGAFDGCTSLPSVTIPESVAYIGDWAFYDCTSLKAIIVDELNANYSGLAGVLFNKNQTTLIHYPWDKAGGEYTVPNSVTNIGNYAFYECPALTGIIIHDSVTSIGDRAFYACPNLANAIIGNGVTSIGNLMFYSCPALSNVAVGRGVTSIGNNAFNSCESLTNIFMPYGVTNIGTRAFYYCHKLTGLTIPSSVTTIGDGAFSLCASLTSITIPTSVTTIGNNLFDNCYGLTNVRIGDGVTRLGREMFNFCLSLTSITIGRSVNRIEYRAFFGCPLTSLYFLGNAPTVDSSAFWNNNPIVYYLPGTTGWRATLAGLTTVLWNPKIQTDDASFGIKAGRFGFTIAGNGNFTVIVEACDDLAHPIWSEIGVGNLANGSFYFSDSQWTNHPVRFYRLRSP